jgi:hypothetical protein
MHPLAVFLRTAFGAVIGLAIGLAFVFVVKAGDAIGDVAGLFLAVLLGGIGLVTGATVAVFHPRTEVHNDAQEDYREPSQS